MSRHFDTLLQSPTAAYEEGLRFFRGEGMMNETLRRLIADLQAQGIDYSVIGGVALNQHGYKRFTEDVNLLLKAEGLETFQQKLVGRGYRPAFPGAKKKFRETGQNVPVEIITTGEYPGDGRPKPVRLHDPAERFTVIDGIKTVDLPKLIELKLASGMTALARLRDLADVQELIRVKSLDAALAIELDESVREKYLEHYASVRAAQAEAEEF